jgi:hypothetical protein
MKTLAAVRFLSFSTQGPSNGSTQGSSKHYQDVAYILCASDKLSLKSELDQVIARFSRDGSLASASILETVYLPFLVVLAKWIEKSKALKFPSFQKLYQNILSSFISQSVTRQPSAPRDWTRRTWGRGCMNCRFLDAFLSNPSRESFEFRRPSDEITHLQNRLGDEIRAGSLQVSADRSGSPHGLLVKKTTKPYDDEVRAWRHKCSKIRQIINSIGFPRLQAVLGAGYGSIMSLKPIPPETTRNPASPQVIDLTGNQTVSQADTPTAPQPNSASTPVSRLS